MQKLFCFLLIMLGTISFMSAQEDAEGCKDPALFTRMPGYHIYRCEDLQFDRYEFYISSGKTQAVEGHHLMVMYDLNENAQTPSPLQTVRNYTNAIKKIGGQLVYEYDDGGVQYVILKVVKDSKEVWAAVASSPNGQVSINVVEKQAMNQDVVADAKSLANSIKESGKAAVYGIYFDTGLSVLKPESKPTLQEIARLLNADPGLNLYVVGHTDSKGTFDANIKLSMDRAAAVVNALVTQFSVNASRLKAFGDGPTAPVSTNDTEEGRALNRRVELVKQ
ncbi:MAG: OmpA family protein [Bacteroidales bacterium]|jgi:outer membrane protein OmpA-like peptidoglycan-associated protein